MKICFVTTMMGSPWGGSEVLWSAAARRALEQGHQVATLTYRFAETPKPINDLREKGALIFHRSTNRRRRSVRVWEQLIHPLPQLVRWHPDVICFSQGWMYEAALCGDLVRWQKRCGSPYVILCQHGGDGYFPSPELRRRAQAFFARASRVVFVARQNQQTLERHLAESVPHSCVVGNPVNLQNLDPVPWPELPVPRLACVARLDTPFKGQDILLEALSQPIWKERPWRLALYGEGRDRPYLGALAGHCGIADRVELCGQIADVRSIWADNQLLILPSRSEGTPLALIEAMICGRPAVVTDVGGNREWIEESQTGFVAEAPTAASVGGALERAWQTREAWPTMGVRARARALVQRDPCPEQTLLDILSAVSQR